jgi:hypothetical protein
MGLDDCPPFFLGIRPTRALSIINSSEKLSGCTKKVQIQVLCELGLVVFVAAS